MVEIFNIKKEVIIFAWMFLLTFSKTFDISLIKKIQTHGHLIDFGVKKVGKFDHPERSTETIVPLQLGLL